MNERSGETTLVHLKRELQQAAAALDEPGAGARANLECRVADLQQRFLTTPARTLADVEARLAVIRDLVAGLGTGYLLDLVDVTLEDVREVRAAAANDAGPADAPRG